MKRHALASWETINSSHPKCSFTFSGDDRRDPLLGMGCFLSCRAGITSGSSIIMSGPASPKVANRQLRGPIYDLTHSEFVRATASWLPSPGVWTASRPDPDYQILIIGKNFDPVYLPSIVAHCKAAEKAAVLNYQCYPGCSIRVKAFGEALQTRSLSLPKERFWIFT